MAYINVVTEGSDDEAVARRLCVETGHEVVAAYPKGGKNALDRDLQGYDNAARFTPWFVLRDLDHDEPCAPSLVDRLLPNPSAQMCFRIAVRTVEVWLLADRTSLAGFLSVSKAKITHDPEILDRPKEFMVNLARRSRSSAIRDDMVPAHGVSSQVGPGYTARLIEFALRYWDPYRGALHSDSLDRCITALSGHAEPHAV